MPPTQPRVYDYPVKRPGHIVQANWLGPDDDLALQLSYHDAGGTLQAMTLFTRNQTHPGEICLPASNDVLDLGPRAKDILAAHVRMAVFIRGQAIPGSAEFEQSLVEQLTSPQYFQTAVGTVKITDVRLIDDICLDIDFRQGTGPIRTFRFDHVEFQNYQFVPSTQLLVVAGAIEKEFPTYVHNYPSQVLTQQQKDAIAAYVLTLAPWI